MELSERPNFSLDHPELLEKTIGLVVSPTKFVVSPTKFVVSPTKTRRIADIGPNQWINSPVVHRPQLAVSPTSILLKTYRRQRLVVSPTKARPITDKDSSDRRRGLGVTPTQMAANH
jgi:hypothetical protein